MCAKQELTLSLSYKFEFLKLAYDRHLRSFYLETVSLCIPGGSSLDQASPCLLSAGIKGMRCCRELFIYFMCASLHELRYTVAVKVSYGSEGIRLLELELQML